MFKLIAFLLRVSPKIVILAIVTGILAGVSNTGLLAVITRALSNSEASGPILVWSFAGLCLLMLLSRAASMILLTRLTLSSTLSLRVRMSRQILATPLRHLEELGAARLLTALTEDVPVITQALSGIPALAMNAAIVVGCLTYMGWLSWKLLIGVLIYIIVGAAIYQLAIMKAARYVRLAREAADALMSHFRSLTDGTKELKLHRRRREAFLTELLESDAGNLQRYNMTANVIYICNAIWGQATIFLLIGLLLFKVSDIVSMTVNILTSYTVMMLYIMGPLEALFNAMPNFNRAVVAMQKVDQLGISLAQNATEGGTSSEKLSLTRWEPLELIGATHSYYRENQENSFMLGPIDLELGHGEVVFITGGNGSGKTTLAKLIIGLYAPESGQVRLNGQEITDRNRESYRQYFSVVFTDFYLFERLLGLESVNLDEEAQRYLALFHLDQAVEVKEGKLSTTKLSQGQRKRLALLTAFLEDRPIYLFDEWAADQDPVFKKVFYLQLIPELKARNKTVIVISHDDHYYHVADRIIKLDYGQIEGDNYSSGLEADANRQVAVRS